MAEPLWEFTSVHLMNVEWWLSDQAKQLVFVSRLPESTPTIVIYYYYSARKLILKAVLWRVEGWVNSGGWLHTKMVYPPADGRPYWYFFFFSYACHEP